MILLPSRGFNGTVLAAFLVAFLTLPLSAQKPAPAAKAESPDFMRFVEAEKTDQLQAAIATYRNAAGVEVDLVGCVHIGDEGYFQTLNQRLDEYDVVLYELVGDPEALKSGAPRKTSPIGFAQKMIKTLLRLEFQLDEIDYQKDHFVHADMTGEDFARAQEENGESMLSVLLNGAMKKMEEAQKNGGAPDANMAELANIDWGKMIRSLGTEEGANDLKRVMARQFDQMETMTAAFGNEDGESVLLTGRNKVAMDMVRKSVGQGKRRIAVFYGAAHLVDFDQRLKALGFKPSRTTWVTAWDIPKKNGESNVPPQRKEKQPEAAKPRFRAPI
ncbi:MAG: hypothetical protein AAF514_03415 [Verrucomicrobiota bacterium]